MNKADTFLAGFFLAVLVIAITAGVIYLVKKRTAWRDQVDAKLRRIDRGPHVEARIITLQREVRMLWDILLEIEQKKDRDVQKEDGE